MGFSEAALVMDRVTVVKTEPKFVLLMLANDAQVFPERGGYAIAWPSVERLALQTGQSHDDVCRQLAELEELGLISAGERREDSAGGDSCRASTVYLLDVSAIRAGQFMDAKFAESLVLGDGPDWDGSSFPGCEEV